MIKVEIIGRLGADAEVKTANGSEFITMRVAHSEKYTDAAGNVKETTTWIDAILPSTRQKLVPYLRAGQLVFLRGHLNLRVYSSKKDRCMKAGATCNVTELELLGSAADKIPGRLIDPASGLIFDVQKLFWVNRDNSKMKKDESYILYSEKGVQFDMNKAGFVSPLENESASADGEDSKPENE